MVSVVISYCNNDFAFLEDNIKQVKKFSNDIIVCYCEHSLNGKLENVTVIDEMKVIVGFYGGKLNKITLDEHKSARWHHNEMRYSGSTLAINNYVLFLDADEILEGDLFKEYIETNEYKNYDVVAFKCYWYFRERKYRAKATEQAGTLCNKSIINQSYIFSEAERWEFKNRPNLRVKENVTYNGNILCHHYSWVRTKEQMINKVMSWGHKNDKDWLSLIEKEFTHDFNGTDFVHHYSYQTV